MVLVHDPSALRTKHVYEPTKLRNILENYQQNRDFRYKKLPIDAIKTIRNLKLNHKRRQHRYTAQKGESNMFMIKDPD